jgi:DNA-binding XRE family transcriptional regulator
VNVNNDSDALTNRLAEILARVGDLCIELGAPAHEVAQVLSGTTDRWFAIESTHLADDAAVGLEELARVLRQRSAPAGVPALEPDLAPTTFEDTIEAWLLRALGGRRSKYVIPLARRLGFGVLTAWTLERAGQEAHVTRERIRQVERDLLVALPQAEPPIAAIESVIEILANLTPVSTDDAHEELRRHPEVQMALDLHSFLHLARLLGVDDTPEIVGGSIGIVTAEAERTDALARIVLQGWHDFDLQHISQVQLRAVAQLDDVRLEEIAEVLARTPNRDEIIHLGCGWYYRRPAELTSTRKQLPVVISTIHTTLSVCGQLTIDSLWRGVVRRAKRQNLPFPDLVTFGRLLEYLDMVSVEGDRVELREAWPKRTLSKGDRAILSAIDSSKRGWISYFELKEAVVNAGLTEAMASHASMFSPIIMRIGRDKWVLRTGDKPELEGRTETTSVDPQWAAELRDVRRQLGISQERLATVLGVHQATISNYEREKEPIPQAIHDRIGQLLSESTD